MHPPRFARVVECAAQLNRRPSRARIEGSAEGSHLNLGIGGTIMGSKRRKVGSFPAKDASGNQHIVYVSEDVHDAPTFEGAGEVVGITHLTIGNMHGQRLNRVAKGEYMTLTGVKLTSSHPNAV
jgi:hypothetical protein